MGVLIPNQFERHFTSTNLLLLGAIVILCVPLSLVIIHYTAPASFLKVQQLILKRQRS